MKKYIGILLVLLGAVVLVVCYFAGLQDYNSVLFSGLGLTILGLITHIVVTKRTR